MTKIINVAVLVWLYQYLLKRIAPEEYALYPVVMSVMAFLPLLTVVLTSGVGRYVVEAYAKGDEEGVTQIVSTMFPLHLAAGLIILGLGGVFAWNIDRILTIAPGRLWDARLMMGLAVFKFAVSLILAPFGVGLYVRQRFVLANLIGIGAELLRIGILFTLLFAVSTRVLWVAVALTASGLVHLSVTQVISRRLVPALRFRLSAIRWSRARTLTGFGFWNFIASLSDTIRTSADAIILNKLATPVDVTCFHLGSLPFQKVHEGVMTAKGPLGPAVTAMHAHDQKERLRNVYLRGGRYGLWFTMLFATPLIVFRRELFALYAPPQYAASATVMALLLLQFPFVYGNNMVGCLAVATARIRPLSLAHLCANVGNLAITLYFVGILGLGAVGSALGTLLTLGLLSPLIFLPIGLRLSGTSLRTWTSEVLAPGLFPGACGACVALGLKALPVWHTWLTLTAFFSITCLISGAIVACWGLRRYDPTIAATLQRYFGELTRCVGLRRSSQSGPEDARPSFEGSAVYWEARYASGGNSGAGSMGASAHFKAAVLNDFVLKQGVRSVIEFGCGDGGQLALARYPSYLGVDVSPTAVATCTRLHAHRPEMAFCSLEDYEGQRAHAALSVDVIYHLVEDHVFEEHMRTLFAASDGWVVIYSTDTSTWPQPSAPHVRHRKFTDWVKEHCPEWHLTRRVQNPYAPRGSGSDFFIYALNGMTRKPVS